MTHAPFRAIDGLDDVLVWQPAASLRVSISDEGPHSYSAEHEQRWNALRESNPRVFDGPILAVDAIDAGASLIRARRERYKRLAVQDHPAPGPDAVWLLGVKGWITARDASGREHVLIARRGVQTRIYHGLWECAPAGGVDPPSPAVSELSTDSLAQTLVTEAAEELGIELDPRGARVLAVCRDLVAGSDDIVIAIELARIIDPRRPPSCARAHSGWEYSDTAWLARADARSFDRATTLVPPTRAILRLLAWT